MSLLTELLVLIASALVVLYVWAKYTFSYWKRKNIPYIEPSLLFGNFKQIVTMHTSAAEHLTDLYNNEKAKDQSVVGIHIFNKPALLLRDPELIKTLLVNEFYKFPNRYSAGDPKSDAVGSNNLFFIKNPHWKELRTKLTPFFSSGRIKKMFPLMEEIGNGLDEYLCALEIDPKTQSSVQELKEVCALYTTDVIASVAFGVQANSLKNPEGDFRRNGRRIFDFTFGRTVELATIFFLPYLVKILRSKVFSKDTTEFLRNSINFVMNERIRNGNIRHDLIDMLIVFKKDAEADPEKKHFALDNDVLVGQAAIFFTGGYETSAATMSFALYELSKKPEVQTRLREEIKAALLANNNKVTYEMANELEYLKMVVQEVLRLYPPLPFLDRVCSLPKGEKEFPLQAYGDFGIPNGMPIYIPLYGIQRDPKYFPNPEEFDPERFSSKNKDTINPLAYMPFGTGPHACIGERFGSLQSKIGLINFLRNHYVRPCEKSYTKMILDPRAVMIQAMGGIHCTVVRDRLI